MTDDDRTMAVSDHETLLPSIVDALGDNLPPARVDEYLVVLAPDDRPIDDPRSAVVAVTQLVDRAARAGVLTPFLLGLYPLRSVEDLDAVPYLHPCESCTARRGVLRDVLANSEGNAGGWYAVFGTYPERLLYERARAAGWTGAPPSTSAPEPPPEPGTGATCSPCTTRPHRSRHGGPTLHEITPALAAQYARDYNLTLPDPDKLRLDGTPPDCVDAVRVFAAAAVELGRRGYDPAGILADCRWQALIEALERALPGFDGDGVERKALNDVIPSVLTALGELQAAEREALAHVSTILKVGR